MSFVHQVWGTTKKAFVGSTALVLFGFFIMALSVFAMHDRLGAFEATASGKIEYYLPYPGILPDNPVYKLKAARDRISLWLTFSEVKKAEKELLFANKRIGAAKVLVEGGKLALGVTTATKAEKYLESAYVRLDKQSKAGVDVKSQILEIQKAAIKHQEILEEISGAEEILKMNKLLQQQMKQTWIEAK